jgi:hypothetical protein
MGLLDAYQESTDTALRVMASQPLEPEPVKPKHSAWSTPFRAVAAGAAEVAGNVVDTAGAFGQVAASVGGVSPGFDPDAGKKQQASQEAMQALQTDGINWRTDEARQAYQFGADLRPDPLTAGTAENLVFGLTKGLTKAIGAAVALGPVAGATAFGASEGMTASEDLAEQGVDQATRMQVGAVTAAMNTAGVLLPVAGQTLKQTIGLVAVGGPGTFIAQQAATREILRNADYGAIAEQYDPLDPVGLTVATLLPAGFAAYAKRGGFRPTIAPRADGQPVAEAAPVTQESSIPATPEAIDAAMVQNLTVARDVHAEVQAKIDYIDPRLENPEVRDWFDRMRTETGWVEEGGKVLRDGEDGAVIGRTKWIPNYEWWAGRPDSLNDADTVKAIDKALRGEKLNAKEKRMAQYLVDVAQERVRSDDYWPSADELNVSGLADNDSMQVAMVARASEFDADAVERLAIQHENDDAAFMRGVKELLDGKDQDTQAGGSGRADQQTEVRAGAAAESQDVDAYRARVEALTKEQPDLIARLDEAGQPVKLSDELEMIRKQAREGTDTEFGADDAPLLKVAAECALAIGTAAQ